MPRSAGINHETAEFGDRACELGVGPVDCIEAGEGFACGGHYLLADPRTDDRGKGGAAGRQTWLKRMRRGTRPGEGRGIPRSSTPRSASAARGGAAQGTQSAGRCPLSGYRWVHRAGNAFAGSCPCSNPVLLPPDDRWWYLSMFTCPSWATEMGRACKLLLRRLCTGSRPSCGSVIGRCRFSFRTIRVPRPGPPEGRFQRSSSDPQGCRRTVLS